MFKKIVLIIILLILFTGFASAEDNSTDIIDVADDGDALGDSVKPLKDAHDLINNAEEGHTVKLNGTYQYQGNSDESWIDITRNITIEGEGKCVFDGNGNIIRITVLTGQNVVIKNIKFVNINTGSLVYNEGNLTLFNCTFENINTGYMISNKNIMSIDNCVFKDNVASERIISSGEEPNLIISKFKLTNSRLINNDAINLIYAYQHKSTVISDNLFYNNTVRENLILFKDDREQDNEKGNIFIFTRNVLISNMNGTRPAGIFIKPPTTQVKVSAEGMTNTEYTLTTTIKDNFWGRNIHDGREITMLDYISFYENIMYNHLNPGGENEMTWCNVEVEKLDGGNYKLCYVNKDGQILNLTNATFNIKDRRTNDVLAQDVGIGTFHLDSDINTSDILILTSENKTLNMIPARLVYTVTGTTYLDMKIFVTLYDCNNHTLSNERIRIDIYSPEENCIIESCQIYTNSEGLAYCDGKNHNPGEYYPQSFIHGRYTQLNITTTFSSEEYGFAQENIFIMPKKFPFKATASPVTTTYNSKANVKITVSHDKPLPPSEKISLMAEVYQGKKLIKSYFLEFDSNTASIELPKLKAGTYTLKMTYAPDEFAMTSKDVKITVNKLKLTAKAPKVTYKYKKSKYFKVTVKNGKNIKIKVKVYTGKKAKTYTLKTNSKGIAKLNTKKLKVGKHKVVITSGNSNYKISAKSLITIK